MFILIGILAGSDGIGKIYFDDYQKAQSIGVVALCYILFMGGLSVDFNEIKPVITKGTILATVGVALTAVITGGMSYFFLDLPLSESMLLGAIVSSTDAAAVFSVLRSKDISLRGDLKPLLEFESGANDPMAVLMTVALISFISSSTTNFVDLGVIFTKQMVLGLGFGVAIGLGAVKLINRIRFEYSGLYVVLSLAIVMLAYSLPAILGGSGFASVYICALVMAKSKFIYKRMLTKFHDGIAWFCQVLMFVILGLLAFIKEVANVWSEGLIVAAILMFVARPIAVAISLMPFKAKLNEIILISWVGLRGAAPIVLATFPLIANVNGSHEIFNIVFFVVLISVFLQGTTIPLIAKLLKLDAPFENELNSPFEFDDIETDKKLVKLQVMPNSQSVNKEIREIKLPKDTIITMYRRDDSYQIPSGTTVIQACDILYIMSKKEYECSLKEIFEKGCKKQN